MIAQKLRYYRLMQRITQRDLSVAAGLHKSSIGNIESRNTDVMFSVVVKIAKALDVKMEKLIGDLTETEKEEMRIANGKLQEIRTENRIAKAREQKRRYNARQAQLNVK